MTTEAVAVQSSSVLALDAEELRAIPLSRAEQIRAVFLPMAERVQAFEDAYNEIMAEAAEAVTKDVSQRARRLRLDIAKVRQDAETARKSAKEEYLRASQAIDGTNRVLRWAIEAKEEALLAIEQHEQRMEEERLAALHAERLEAIAPYMEDTTGIDFSQMADDVWEAYLTTKKRNHEDRIAAEAEAEAARVAAAERQARYIARQARVAPVYGFFPQDLDYTDLTDEAFDAELQKATEAKTAHDMEQEAVRREAARLAAENARIEAERNALEKAEADRLAAEQVERARLAIEAAETAAAPIRARLNAWVESFTLPELAGDDHPTAAEIRAKHEAFKRWAREKVEAV